jgi:hypothetical protein
MCRDRILTQDLVRKYEGHIERACIFADTSGYPLKTSKLPTFKRHVQTKLRWNGTNNRSELEVLILQSATWTFQRLHYIVCHILLDQAPSIWKFWLLHCYTLQLADLSDGGVEGGMFKIQYGWRWVGHGYQMNVIVAVLCCRMRDQRLLLESRLGIMKRAKPSPCSLRRFDR